MRKSIIYIPCLLVLMAMLACGGKEQQPKATVSQPKKEFVYIPLEKDLKWQSKYINRVKKGPRKYERVPVNEWGDLAVIFDDRNRAQYAYAEKLGIQPINNFSDTYITNKQLVKVQSCKYYNIEPLTHSLPYLVPRAEMLLRDIGRNFIDSLASRGADGYRIAVTSLLRTKASVRELRKVNINATDSSTHKFATTFDICWNYFVCDDTTRTLNGDDLKWVLAEVLEDLRKQHRCMVKYEEKTHCFHITVTD